jgi:hypothetical protein
LRIHPLLISYKDLPYDEQERDRRTIRQFPNYVQQAKSSDRLAGEQLAAGRSDTGRPKD